MDPAQNLIVLPHQQQNRLSQPIERVVALPGKEP
jgi:hypothetical protein